MNECSRGSCRRVARVGKLCDYHKALARKHSELYRVRSGVVVGQRTCSRCEEKGHLRTTCPVDAPLTLEEIMEIVDRLRGRSVSEEARQVCDEILALWSGGGAG